LQFTAVHECGTNITVYNATNNSSIDAQIQDAIDRWDDRIFPSMISGLPFFTRVTSSGGAVVTIVGDGGGPIVCGQIDVAGNGVSTLTLLSGSSACAAYNRGSVQDVVAHELSHAYGWDSDAHKKGATGIADHCAVFLHDNHTLNSQVCAHEIEGAAAGYGLRSFDTNDFWDKDFAVSSSTMSPTSIVAGTTYQYSAPTWILERGGSVAGSFSWYSSTPSVATVSNGLVTGVSPGTALIFLRGDGSTTYHMTQRFELQAGSVTVTVTAPPLAALYVDDITMNGAIPITSPDSFTWTAVPASGNSSGISYNWIVEYSDTSPPDSIFIPSTSNTWRGYARAGSYNVRIKVWPVRNDSIGSPAIRDFPVCTGNTEYLRFEPKDETDATGGC